MVWGALDLHTILERWDALPVACATELATSGYKPLDFKTLPYTINMCCLEQIIQPEEVASKTGLGYLHTTHCLANGEVMISSLGTSDGEGEGKVISFLPRVITCFN